MSRSWRPLLLGLALCWAQMTLAMHGIEHAFHDHDEACITCLALPGFAAAPSSLATLPAIPPTPLAPQDAVPPAPSFALWLAFHSRAPPLLQN